MKLGSYKFININFFFKKLDVVPDGQITSNSNFLKVLR